VIAKIMPSSGVSNIAVGKLAHENLRDHEITYESNSKFLGTIHIREVGSKGTFAPVRLESKLAFTAQILSFAFSKC